MQVQIDANVTSHIYNVFSWYSLEILYILCLEQNNCSLLLPIHVFSFWFDIQFITQIFTLE